MHKQAFSLLSVALFAALLLAGCGSNSSMMTNRTATAMRTAVVNVGDDPSDSVLAFEVTINSILLTDSMGHQTSVLAAPTRIEVTRLAGTFAALAQVTLPPGSFTGAVITISKPEITFVNPVGAVVEISPVLASTTVNVAFSPALVVGSTAAAFNFDFDVAQSVTFDAAGVPSIHPVITVVPATASAAVGLHPENGDVDDLKGVVSATTANSFTITVHDGTQSVTFTVDSMTQFSGIGSLADLKAGMQVEVAAAAQADGSLLAKKVEVEMELEGDEANGANLEGLVTATTGNPATQISVLVRDIESSMPGAPALGSTVNLLVTSNTKFAVNTMDFGVPSLPFTPKFDATTITKGQNVEVEADLASSTPTAAKIKLARQALHGTATGITTSGSVTTFTLTLPADSAFLALTGATTVTVYETSETELKGLTSVSEGTSVRVRGLLFFDGTTFRLVAKAIAKT